LRFRDPLGGGLTDVSLALAVVFLLNGLA